MNLKIDFKLVPQYQMNLYIISRYVTLLFIDNYIFKEFNNLKMCIAAPPLK